MPSIEEIRELLKQMSEEQRLELIRLCNIENNKSKENEYLLQLSNNHHCPHCNSNHIVKNGTAHKTIPQFLCRDCKKCYTIRTNTIFYYSKKNIKLWQEYIELFSQGLSLRKIVEKMNNQISLPTAFYWRHKILKVLSNKDSNNKLGGIVEADETYFEESQKGSRNMIRKPRKRGYSSEYRQSGLSYNKVCVLTAIDRSKNTFGKPVGYGKVDKNEVLLLRRHLQNNSILITDGDNSYTTLNNVRLKKLKFGKPLDKVYHLNNINNFHSKLKQFMIRFNGVSTKFLEYYVEYFRKVKDKVDVFGELLNCAYYWRVCDIKQQKICFESAINKMCS